MNINHPKVPNSINKNVKLLLSKISSLNAPIYVPCEPNKNEPLNECIKVVENRIKVDGGEMILGWQIWEGLLLIESEFHAVWQAPNGNLIDISPKPFLLEKIMFVIDSNIEYRGQQINNIRINITTNSLIDDLITILDSIFEIENKGERATQYTFSISGKESDIYTNLKTYKDKIMIWAKGGLRKNDVCGCGSGVKYELCHRKKLRKIVKKI